MDSAPPATGQIIDPRPRGPDAALALSASIPALACSAYVGLVGRAGSVFAARVPYLVTGFGVLWSIALLGASCSSYVWAAPALMLAEPAPGQPGPPLAAFVAPGDDADRKLDGTP